MLEGVAERAAQDASAQGAQNEQLSAETKDFGEMYGQIIGTSKETNECMKKSHPNFERLVLVCIEADCCK